MQGGGIGRIGAQEESLEAECAEGFRPCLADAVVIADDDLGAAAADVDDEEALLGMRPEAADAEVDEAGFLLSGDDLDFGAERGGGAGHELKLVAGVADGGGGDGADVRDIEPFVGSRHGGEHLADEREGFGADAAGFEDAFAEAGDLAVGGEDAGRRAGQDFRGFHANRVAADIYSGVARHRPL